MAAAVTDSAIVGIVTVATVITGHIFTIYMTERRRRWDREDRAAIALALKAQNDELAQTIAEQAENIAAMHSSELAANTAISQNAFIEANCVNQKIAEQAKQNGMVLRVVKASIRKDKG